MQGAEPLPPPPASVDSNRILKGPWRGMFWLGFRLHVGGPVAGERPAKATAVAIGGGVDFGWRINNWIGLGMGLSGQVHDQQRFPIDQELDLLRYGSLLVWDIAFLRLHAPVRGRVQPYIEAGGGLVRYNRPAGGYLLGAHLRTGLGVDFWISPNVTLGTILAYRMTGLEQRYVDDTSAWTLGHSLQGILQLAFHW